MSAQRFTRWLRDPLPWTFALLLALVFGMNHLHGCSPPGSPIWTGRSISKTALSRWCGRICCWWQFPA
ncbi:Uncharacterised protein [Serratia plymuthica]|uniref:Uncharacterized protein n=1 Tax=Serratia plymuthica TaxID=82996 RepID=A0A2X4UKT2_SERPL|nr:Uncharacterised protein [Serratia plymuthica]